MKMSGHLNTLKHIKYSNRYFVEIFWKFWTQAKVKLLTFERILVFDCMIQDKHLKNPQLQT